MPTEGIPVMTLNSSACGAVFTKTYRDARTVVTIEPDGDCDLLFRAVTNGAITDTDRASFDTTAERDEALTSVIAEFVDAGYERAT